MTLTATPIVKTISILTKDLESAQERVATFADALKGETHPLYRLERAGDTFAAAAEVECLRDAISLIEAIGIAAAATEFEAAVLEQVRQMSSSSSSATANFAKICRLDATQKMARRLRGIADRSK